MERIFVADTFKNKIDLVTIFVFRATYPEKKFLFADETCTHLTEQYNNTKLKTFRKSVFLARKVFFDLIG